eukprot:scaffold1924_cov218-Amphora_coffeaeformis.AAC.4
MANNNNNNNGGGGYSFFESTFDYRSLLPGQRPPSAVDAEYGDEGEESSSSWCYEMSLRERLLGCGTCMVAGFLLSMGSFWRISALVVRHDPFPFVVNATVQHHSLILRHLSIQYQQGNCLALAGSFFLMGPKAQWNRMWREERRIATLLYLGTLGGTLLVAFMYSHIWGPKELGYRGLAIRLYIRPNDQGRRVKEPELVAINKRLILRQDGGKVIIGWISTTSWRSSGMVLVIESKIHVSPLVGIMVVAWREKKKSTSLPLVRTFLFEETSESSTISLLEVFYHSSEPPKRPLLCCTTLIGKMTEEKIYEVYDPEERDVPSDLVVWITRPKRGPHACCTNKIHDFHRLFDALHDHYAKDEREVQMRKWIYMYDEMGGIFVRYIVPGGPPPFVKYGEKTIVVPIEEVTHDFGIGNLKKRKCEKDI